MHCAQYTSRLGRLSIYMYWLQHKGSTRNLISLLNFLVATTKYALFAIGSTIKKQLCCTVGPVIINKDCISVIAAKITSVKWHKEMKPTLSVSWKKYVVFILSCFSIWSWWLFELVFVFPYAMYKCTCLKLKQVLGLTKRIYFMPFLFNA